MNNQQWLIIGGTSGIAQHLARELAQRGCPLILAVRDPKSALTQTIARDLTARSRITPGLERFEATELIQNQRFFELLENKYGTIYGIIWSVGVKEQLEAGESNFSKIANQHQINYLAAVSVLSRAAEVMADRRDGHIVALGSPAGDRGRKQNFYYGADKAALHTYLQGLRHRLAFKNVKVLTVKPGPTDTRMTDSYENRNLISDPRAVAQDIMRAIILNRNVVYTPWKWKIIMMLVRHIPEPIFKFLNF